MTLRPPRFLRRLMVQSTGKCPRFWDEHRHQVSISDTDLRRNVEALKPEARADQRNK
jgi:hypothetical protein